MADQGSARPVGALFLKALRSPSLLSAAGFALSGAAFALGNLLLARALSIEVYGRFALLVAIYFAAAPLAPAGLDHVCLRRRVDPAGRAVAATLPFALSLGAAGALAGAAFGMAATPALLLGLALACSGPLLLAAGFFRRDRRNALAILLANTANAAVLLAGLLVTVMPLRTEEALLFIVAAALALASAFAWGRLLSAHRLPEDQRERAPWRECLSFIGVVGSTSLAMQMERLVTPVLLDVAALASFSVLSSVAIFPFRMLRNGIGFAMEPRLRAARTIAERRRLLRSELMLTGAVMVLAAVVVVGAAPPFTRWFTEGRYELPRSLVLAACVSGMAMVAYAIARAVVTACGSAREVAVLNRFGWLGVAGGLTGAVIGSQLGLTGLVLGAGLGNLAAQVPALLTARRALLRPVS